MSIQYKDYYKILDISRSATEKEIKSAYRKLARKYHPDVNPGEAERFKDINEAYQVLGDAEKRRYYDNLGSNWRHGAGFDPSTAGASSYGSYVNFNDLGSIFGGGAKGGGDFSDFFDLLFGQMAGQQAQRQGSPFDGFQGGGRNQAQAGGPSYGQQTQQAATEQNLPIQLEDVVKGAQKNVYLEHSGKKVTINIPKGVNEKTKIRLAKEGKAGLDGQPGDMFLIIQYQQDPRFIVEGRNIIHEVKVNIPNLVVGSEISIPTLEGKVTLSIPPGNQTKKTLRLKGNGLPDKQGNRGDLLVRITGKLPEDLTEQEMELYRNLKTLRES